jgi:hypothetical protein
MDTRQFGGNLPPLGRQLRAPKPRRSYGFTLGPVASLVFNAVSLIFPAWMIYLLVRIAEHVHAWPF